MSALSNPNQRTIVVLHGDQTGEELLKEALRVLVPEVIGIELDFQHFDLSLEKRRETQNEVVREAAAAMSETGLGMKAATITPPEAGDVGSPNALLRDAIDGTVILRTGRRIPGVRPVGGVHDPISIVRMAVDDAYGAKEWRETAPDGDEIAYRTSHISRSVCRSVAEFSFLLAARTGARVFGGPKFTVSPVYEGMLKEELDAAAERHPEVPYEPVLIDATYAGLIGGAPEAPLVVPALNRDGDCLSDLVMPLFGSIAGAESVLIAFDDAYEVERVMSEAPHGTAPGLQGKDVANPMAMILAAGALLHYVAEQRSSVESGLAKRADRASRAIYEAVFEATAAGTRTADLGGHASTTEFTDAVLERVSGKLETWSAIGAS